MTPTTTVVGSCESPYSAISTVAHIDKGMLLLRLMAYYTQTARDLHADGLQFLLVSYSGPHLLLQGSQATVSDETSRITTIAGLSSMYDFVPCSWPVSWFSPHSMIGNH